MPSLGVGWVGGSWQHIALKLAGRLPSSGHRAGCFHHMSPRVVALAGTLIQWEVLTGFHTIKLTADVYGMYVADTCLQRDSPHREPLTPASASSSHLAVGGYSCHQHVTALHSRWACVLG